jgi:hypothetical protein
MSSAAQSQYLGLRAPLRRTSRREPCPHCGGIFPANGLWLHTRACERKQAEAVGPQPIRRDLWDADLAECDRLITVGAGDTPRRCWKCGAEGTVVRLNSNGAFRCMKCRGRWGY